MVNECPGCGHGADKHRYRLVSMGYITRPGGGPLDVMPLWAKRLKCSIPECPCTDSRMPAL